MREAKAEHAKLSERERQLRTLVARAAAADAQKGAWESQTPHAKKQQELLRSYEPT